MRQGRKLELSSDSIGTEKALEHVPEKWTRFSDKDMLQVFELARILFDQVIPPDRKAR
jgi:hypothetical protein